VKQGKTHMKQAVSMINQQKKEQNSLLGCHNKKNIHETACLGAVLTK
jgi:hypothetical protein